MRKYILVLVAAVALIGWKSAPIKTDLGRVTQNPTEFKNKQIELTAPIADNPAPEGHEFKTWTFTLASDGEEIELKAYERGFNPATIMKAYRLVEKARLAGDPVTVVGRLKKTDAGRELALTSVRYGNTQINTNDGPFTQTVYGDCYPGSPLFYDGYTYYSGNFPY